MRVQKVNDFEELQCRKMAVKLYYKQSKIVKARGREQDDEIVCRWLVSGLHISGKIAFAFGAEDYEWFVERLPLAKKYCAECAFWTQVLVDKKMLRKYQAQEMIDELKRIIKKVNAIIRYLEKYEEQEKYNRQVFFDFPEGR